MCTKCLLARAARPSRRVPREPGPLPPAMAHRVALGVAVARIALGLTAIVAPAVVARPWIGSEAGDPGSKLLGRVLGGRDLALGLGPVLAERHRGPLRGWVEAGALADLVDTAATLAAFRRLPRQGRWLVLAAAGGAAAAGGLSSLSL